VTGSGPVVLAGPVVVGSSPVVLLAVVVAASPVVGVTPVEGPPPLLPVSASPPELQAIDRSSARARTGRMRAASTARAQPVNPPADDETRRGRGEHASTTTAVAGVWPVTSRRS
jgi:hypothetical protein